MPYEVAFDASDMTVTVQVSGEATHEEHCAARSEAVLLCQEEHCSRLLVDLRGLNTARSSTLGCFDFGRSFPQTSPPIRLAHVLPRDAKSRADVAFTSTVEANRGVSSREFETVDEARKWLLEGA